MTQPPNLPDIITEIPGPRSRRMAARLRAVESPDATAFSDDFPVVWSEARACNVWDVDGNRYLDLVAGFGAAALGHAHHAVVDAVSRQAARLLHGMGDVHPTEIRLKLSERIESIAPTPGPWKAIYGLNGSDAVEAALKTAALATERPGVIAFDGGYHGLSLGALAVTSGEKFREGFDGLLPPHAVTFPYPGFLDESAEEARLLLKEIQEFLDTERGQTIGAVIVEPLAGRGGVVTPPKNFLPGLRKLCDRNKLILIFDEIFTGVGRTGRWFACEHESVAPDLLLIGKALGGGAPISVCLGMRRRHRRLARKPWRGPPHLDLHRPPARLRRRPRRHRRHRT
jgi:4-aminobutyrate aminotransferase-like enzyme